MHLQSYFKSRVIYFAIKYKYIASFSSTLSPNCRQKMEYKMQQRGILQNPGNITVYGKNAETFKTI